MWQTLLVWEALLTNLKEPNTQIGYCSLQQKVKPWCELQPSGPPNKYCMFFPSDSLWGDHEANSAFHSCTQMFFLSLSNTEVMCSELKCGSTPYNVAKQQTGTSQWETKILRILLIYILHFTLRRHPDKHNNKCKEWGVVQEERAQDGQNLWLGRCDWL